MPPSLIEHEDGMGTRCHLLLISARCMPHCLTGAMGHDKPGTFSFSRTDGTKSPG